jgi:putative transcriptional regulator
MNETNISGAMMSELSESGAILSATGQEAAPSDPDARPLSEADLRRMKRTPQVKVLRRALDLTQQEFAIRYQIPLGTLRDWEQGRVVPDQPARAYLKLIAHDPEYANRALNGAAFHESEADAGS